MTQDTDSEEGIGSTDLLKLTSFNQISSESFTHRISVTQGSKSFPGGLITVRRTVHQVEEEIAIMEVNPAKPAKSVAQKAGKLFSGRLLKSLFDSSPAEVVFNEHKRHSKDKGREQKEGSLKSSSNKLSSSSGSGGKPYTIASASPPPHPPRKATDPAEFDGYEEPLSTPFYPATRKSHLRKDSHDSSITPGIRSYGKPREIKLLKPSKYSLEKDSPGRSSRTTSTETSSHSNNFESDFDISTDSTGGRASRREKESSQQTLIDRLHAEAMKMKLEKAEDEMLKLRLEVDSRAHPQNPTQQLDAYRSDSNSNKNFSVDGGDRNGISRINSLEHSTDYTDRRHQDQYGTSYGSAGRPEVAPLRSTLFVADGEDAVKAQQQDDSDREIPPGSWVNYQRELEILDDPDPIEVDNAWRSAQMHTFLQDAASVNTVSASASILNEGRSEKKLAVAVHKRDPQQPTPHSSCQSRVQNPTHLQQEQLQQQRFAQMSQQQQDPRGVHLTPHYRSEDSSTAAMHHYQVHSVERSRSVETVSSTSSSTTQQQRLAIQRTQSVDSNSSSKSCHSPKSSGQSYVSPSRSRTNTTIAERISRTHRMVNGQQSISTSTPQTEIHRHPQQLQAVPNFKAELAVSGANFQAEPLGYQRPQLQPMSHQLEFETYRQPQPQPVDQSQPRQPPQQHSVSDQHRQPQSMPQPELFSRQPQSIPQPEPYNRQQQSHFMLQQQVELDIHRQPQHAQQYREQQQSVLLQQSFEQQRLSQQQQQPGHQRSGSLTFPSLPRLSLDPKTSYENDETVSSPLQLSPTSSGLITPTRMAPPTVFQSDEERAAWQHERTMERMHNARRNREALLLKQRGATAAR